MSTGNDPGTGSTSTRRRRPSVSARAPSASRHAPAHYTVTAKEGFAPVLHCLCGATITLPKVPASSPSAAMRAWLRVHDDCLPSESDAAPGAQEAPA